MKHGLTFLEKAVIEKALDAQGSIFDTLRNQLHFLTSVKREMTGVGFWVTLILSADAPHAHGNPSFELSVFAKPISGLEFGAAFTLTVTNGQINMLEGVSYGSEPWPEEISGFKLQHYSSREADVCNLLAKLDGTGS